jgi:SAM-dependent methyltransferase
VAAHWTHLVYRRHADLFYDVEAALFQNDQLTRQELDLVTELGRRVGAPLASPIVDLACGPGRHGRELARRGFAVTGADLSQPFLAMARAASGPAGPPLPRLLCTDLRRPGLAPQSFDTALLLGNSFGYFSDEENRAILEQIRQILRPGGLLCMEVTNLEAYLDRLEPYQEELVHGRRYPELRCQWWKRWDPETRRVHTLERHSRAATGEVIYEGPYDVRLYGRSELRGLLREAGFPDSACSPFTPSLASLADGLGETFGAMSEVLFVAVRG